VRISCQMEQCNFSTNNFEREERLPFVVKTGDNLLPNGTVTFSTDKTYIHLITVTQLNEEHGTSMTSQMEQ